MTELLQLTVGTRASQMALVQTNRIIKSITDHNPGLSVRQKHITTKGDIDNAPIPLDTVGKAWFTKEIELALLNHEVDVAVHSLKDVPPELPPGLAVMPVLRRDDPRDGLVAKAPVGLTTLPKGAIVGTDSLRRKTLLLRERPDLRVKSIRGNANTRLQKLEAGEYDALVMAVAGLERINRAEMIVEYLNPATFIPSIGQGALAVEIHTERQDLKVMFQKLQDRDTLVATEAELAFAQIIGGGCKLPVACYARIEADTAYVYGMVGSLDATQCIVKSLKGRASEVLALSRQIAKELAKESVVIGYGRAR